MRSGMLQICVVLEIKFDCAAYIGSEICRGRVYALCSKKQRKKLEITE